jgi:hypothetical protein
MYPIVMLEIFFLNPFFDWLPISGENFIGNVFSVGILGWPVVWALSGWMGWLFALLHTAVQVTPVDKLEPGSGTMIPAFIFLVLTVIVSILWFSPLGSRFGIWGGSGDSNGEGDG